MSKNTTNYLNDEYKYCCDTKTAEHISKMLKVGSSYKFIHNGCDNVGFIIISDYGYNIARLVDKNGGKNRLLSSSYYFNGKTTPLEIRDILFNGATAYEDVVTKKESPFIIRYKHTFMSEEDWNSSYTPNISTSKYRSVDKALNSLGALMVSANDGEVVSRRPDLAFMEASKRIVNERKKFVADAPGDSFPIVEAFAIWSNYDAETGLILSDQFDSCEPLVYTFNIYKNKSQMLTNPM